MDELKKFILIAVIGFSALFFFTSTADAHNGQWDFDENTGIIANDTGIGEPTNDGTLMNMNGTAWVPGILNSAVQFDGINDYIDVTPVNVTYDLNFTANNDFTILLWVKTTQPMAAGSWPMILSKEDYGVSPRQGYNIVLHESNNDARWYFEFIAQDVFYPVFGRTNIADGEWHHIAVVRSGSTLKTYEDGYFANQEAGTSASVYNNFHLSFGRNTNQADYYAGSMDRVVYYDGSALGDAEILNYYLQGAVPPPQPANPNLLGFAWSETTGWISFNSKNCDTDGNDFSNGGIGCPVAGTPMANYGVNLDLSTGDMTGYAWSDNIGWIAFDPDVAGSPNPALGPAKLNLGNDQFQGWARACAGTQDGNCVSASRADGWDGWIKMSGTNYAVIKSGDNLNGYAWGDTNVGWVKFSGPNYQVSIINNTPEPPSNFRVTGSSCGTVNLAWDDVTGEASYILERKGHSESTWYGLAGSPLAANTVSYPDAVTPSTAYDYRISACSSGGSCSEYAQLDNVITLCCPNFSLSSSKSIWATIIDAAGADSSDSSQTILSVSPSCNFSKDIELSVVSITGPGNTSGFVPHFEKSGGLATTTLTCAPDAGGCTTNYDTSAFWLTVPSITPGGEYIVTVRGDGTDYIVEITVRLNVEILTPLWEEF